MAARANRDHQLRAPICDYQPALTVTESMPFAYVHHTLDTQIEQISDQQFKQNNWFVNFSKTENCPLN